MAAPIENVDELPKEIQKLLADYPELEFQKSTQKFCTDNIAGYKFNKHGLVDGHLSKIKCSLSGHEMPCKEQAVRDYVKGKKFHKLKKDKEFNYDKLQPHIVPNTKKNHEHQLFCLLTLSHINKTPRHVQGHINGRRYKKELERWKKCQETGEKFRPLCARKRKRDPDIEAEGGKSFLDSDVDSDGSVDSLSDLYPHEEFGAGDEEDILHSESSYEFEDMETKADSNKQAANSSQSTSIGKKTKKKKKNKAKKMKN